MFVIIYYDKRIIAREATGMAGRMIIPLRSLAIISTILALALTALSVANAHEYEYNKRYKWNTSITPTVNSGAGITGSWAVNICNARNDIDWNTKFDMGTC